MNGSFISMSARKTFYIGWHEGVKQKTSHMSLQMALWYLLVDARFWQLSIHLQMNVITDRVLSLFQCFRKVQVLNAPFDIWLNSFFGLTYTCYETVKTYHFFFKLVNKSSFIGRHKKLVRMKINYKYIYKHFHY